MAQPHKGPRRGFLVRWSDEDGLRAKAQAAAAGMTTTDYLTHLVRQDQVGQDDPPLRTARLRDPSSVEGLRATA